MLRVCNQCGNAKELSVDNFRQLANRKGVLSYFRNKCRDCERINSVQWGRDHSDLHRAKTAEFTRSNPDYKANWKAKNKIHIREYWSKYEKQVHIKLKKRVSRAIKHALEKRGARKNTDTLSFLPYSIEELRLHLESKFEPWMNWGNWGVYNPSTWNDNNSATWTWQLDHIKPMATHAYSCESDAGFRDAWKLENLRPLRSKDNIVLGANMKRVKNTNKLILEVA